MNLGNRLRRSRFDAGEMTQARLAELIGVTRMTIYSIEKGNYVPSTILALKIAKVFGKRVEDLFFLDDAGNEGGEHENS